MNRKPDLNGENWEAELQQALASLPVEGAPRSLQRKLKRIPRQHGSRQWPGWLRPAWVFALAAIPVALVLVLQQQQLSQQQRAIAQGKRDLALVLAYIEKTNQITNRQVMTVIDRGMNQPVKDQTTQLLQQPLDTSREYEL